MCEPIREGQLFVQQQKFGIKSWKKNRAMLYANSGSGVARLEYYESKESGSTSDKGTDRAARRADKRVVRLADCVSVRAAPLEVAPRLCVAFLLETAERHFVFAAELADAAAWVRTLCELAFPKMSSDAVRMEMSTAQMEENSLYGCRESANEFWVSIHKTEASERCGLVGSYKLKGDQEDLTLKDPASGNAIYVWPYKLLRRFGRDKTSFTFEAGRRCNSGPGTFMFDTKNGNDIFNIIEKSINQTKLNRNSQNYTEGDVQSVPVHCPWSSELYTSMGLGEEGAEAAPGPQGNSKREMFDGTPGTPPGQYGHRVHSMEGTDAPAIPPNHPKHGSNAKEQADFPKNAVKGRPAFDNAETFTPIIFEPEALCLRQAGPRSSSVRVRPPEDAPKVPEMGMRHWQTSTSKTKPLEENLTLEELSGCSRSGSANNKSKLSEYLLKPEDGGIMQPSNKQKEDSPKQTPHSFACLFVDEEVAKLSLVKSSQNYDRRMAPPQSIVVKPFPISPSLPGMSPTAKSSSSAGSTPPRSPLPRPPLLDPCLARLESLQDVYADPADSLMLTIKLDDKASASSSSSLSHYHDPETENNHPCVTGKLRSNGLLAVAKQKESAPEPVYSDPYEKVEQKNTEASSSRRQGQTPEHIYDEPEGIEKPTASLYDEALQIKGDAWKVQAKPEHAYNEQPFPSPIDSFAAPLPALNPQKNQSMESPPLHSKNTEQAPQLPPKPRQMVAQKFGPKPPTTEVRGWNTANSNNSNSKLCPKPRIAPKPKVENVSGREPKRKSMESTEECKGVVVVHSKNDKDSKIVLKKPPMKPIMVAVSYANDNL
uniref:Uncharacterized protein LOC116940472 n=1 Tax=Petromyzon marinus TaxID=7757 RepID=A0AAJ7SVD0_PETMA|nr:uncharacterized protein LOC116940472 [Petromyzon marinus]